VTYETISYELDGAIARLTLNRPDAGNGISLELARDLMHATMEISDARDVRVVVLRGSGRNFCVGGDLKSFAGRSDVGLHLKEVTTYLHAAVSRLARIDAPVVAAVQGSAAGAGLSLVCSCDVVLAAASARFVMAYTRVGLSPDGSATWFLPRVVGLRRAMELTLTNRMLSAGDAEAWGIVTRVLADDELDAGTDQMVAELAGGPTCAFGASKRLLRDSLGESLETQMELETLALAASAATADGREGITAFLDKRPPQFSGR
jgi:2-(1,2-epoxy-1,2-dihydrophenyl)acetyl-CoA isomerase